MERYRRKIGLTNMRCKARKVGAERARDLGTRYGRRRGERNIGPGDRAPRFGITF